MKQMFRKADTAVKKSVLFIHGNVGFLLILLTNYYGESDVSLLTVLFVFINIVPSTIYYCSTRFMIISGLS